MMKFKNSLLVLFLFVIFASSCEKSGECEDGSEMVFRSFSGVSEECGLLLGLDLDDEYRILLPINLSDFDITPEDGLKVCATFIERIESSQACSDAETVELLELYIR